MSHAPHRFPRPAVAAVTVLALAALGVACSGSAGTAGGGFAQAYTSSGGTVVTSSSRGYAMRPPMGGGDESAARYRGAPTSTPSATAQSSGSGSAGAAPSRAYGGGAPSADMSVAPSYAPPSSGSTTAQAEPPPETRPGLATEYGESRTSYMSYTTFSRANPSTPFATLAMNYNDAHGSSMQALMHGGTPAVYFMETWHGGIHVSLRDEHGQPLPGYHMGDRVYMVGEAGRRYSVYLENTTPLRMEAVVSVDGVDVISGNAANTDARGYLVAPYGHLSIDGFRQSNATVAAFRFGSVADSYAAQTQGTARNVGVIGVALFHEVGAILTPPAVDEYQLREQANPFPGGGSSQFAPPPPRRGWY